MPSKKVEKRTLPVIKPLKRLIRVANRVIEKDNAEWSQTKKFLRVLGAVAERESSESDKTYIDSATDLMDMMLIDDEEAATSDSFREATRLWSHLTKYEKLFEGSTVTPGIATFLSAMNAIEICQNRRERDDGEGGMKAPCDSDFNLWLEGMEHTVDLDIEEEDNTNDDVENLWPSVRKKTPTLLIND